MRPLVLIGGGGHCKSVIEVAESSGRAIKGVLGVAAEVGKRVLGIPILGTDERICDYVETCEFIIAIGFIKNPSLRIKLYDKVLKAGGQLATLVASTAYVSRYATLGAGSVVMHHAFVNAGATIGANTIINTFCNIEHDVRIGDQCHISTGTMVNGDCKIGNSCFIGSQSVLVNGVNVCDNVVVGAGGLVAKDILEPGIYVGNPALLKMKNEG